MTVEYDFVVIGGGMAGASIAAHLSEHASVRLLEMEPQPGYHSTGRSAALFAEFYGKEIIRALTRASRSFFYSPPPSFCNAPLVKPRAVLVAARAGQAAALDRFCNSMVGHALELKSPGEALELWPMLRPDDLIGAAFSRNSADIEVHELQSGYMRLLQARKGIATMRAEVIGIQRNAAGWHVTTANETIRARAIVNAAGAWAGEIARLAGATDVELQPLRRTACLIERPAGQNTDHWPMLVDAEELFYVKPDAGMLLLSPADETFTPPCDAQPEELDIAIAVDRLERATTLDVKRVVHKWAGLRSFVEDRSPVVGYDPRQPGFFWMAALGGYGIQTAPALSRFAASLALGKHIDDDLQAQGITASALSPDRITVETAI
jgi:D-arginine dehydrogenase